MQVPTRNRLMTDFCFFGKGPASKSLLIRALIVKSLFPDLVIQGESACEDVRHAEKALRKLKALSSLSGRSAPVFQCGQSASLFRFLALRLSREKGEFILTGDRSLLSRPFHETQGVLGQLSVQAAPVEEGWRIVSKGWAPQGDGVYVPTNISSQYGSGLLLSGWNLPFDLYFSLQGRGASFSYFKMSLEFVRRLGMKVEGEGREYGLKKRQTPNPPFIHIEQDKSGLFALAARAALGGRAVFKPWEKESLQPDARFPEVLKALGVQVTEETKEETLSVQGGFPVRPLDFDLTDCPDMFPVLAVLCSQAETPSRNGAPGKREGLPPVSRLRNTRSQLFKESNRLDKTEELLNLAGVKSQREGEDFLVFGKNKCFSSNEGALKAVEFDCANDHRMAMAGALMQKVCPRLHLIGEDAVKKSFPDFLRIIGAPDNRSG